MLCDCQKEKERATRHFQLIAEAYEVLSKDASRKQYDGIRSRGGQPSANGFAKAPGGFKGGQEGYDWKQQDPAEAARRKSLGRILIHKSLGVHTGRNTIMVESASVM